MAGTDEMPAVGHGAHGAHRLGTTRELEGAARLAQAFVKRVFFDAVVASAAVDGVAVGGPAGAHAPGRRAHAWVDVGDRVGHAAVPDSKRACDGCVEEGGF